MASIYFQFGGQSVEVNASELASESTLNELLGAQKSLNAALGAVKEEGNQSNNILSGIRRGIQEGNKNNEKDNITLMRQMRQGAGNIGNQAIKSSQSATTFNSALSGFFAGLDSTVIATAFGMANQAAIDLGESFRFASRFGLDFGNNFLDVNKRLAGVGLDFTEFSKIIATNQAAIRSLSDSTQSGSMEFLKLNEAFRKGAIAAGGFSMTSAEMSEYLGEELQIRRDSMNQEQFRNATTEQFSAAMLENLKQQQAMAKVTGQDVRERIKAQMEAKKSVIAQSFLSEQSADTRKKFEAMTGALSQLPGGKALGEAIINGIATDLPANAFAPELIARLGGGAEELINFINQGFANGGDLDMTTLQSMVQNVASDVGQSSSVLRTQAALGDSVAEEILTVQQRMVNTQDNMRENFESAYNELTDGVQGSGKELQTLTLELEEQAKLVAALKLETALSIVGDEAGDLGVAFSDFTKNINKFLESDMASSLAQGIGAALGELGPQALLNLGAGNEIDFASEAFLGGVVARSIGQDKIANMLQMNAAVNALGAGGAAFLKDFEPTEIGQDRSGNPIYSEEDQAKLDLRDAFESAREFNLSPTSVAALVSGFASSMQNVIEFFNQQSPN